MQAAFARLCPPPAKCLSRLSTATRLQTLALHPTWSRPISSKGQRGGRASTVSIDIKAALSDAVPLPALAPDDSHGSRRKGYPTVIQQAKNNMERFSHCVLLTRVGSFYELYFEQAEQNAPLLGLKLGVKSTTNGPVPIAGFPFFQLDRYLKFLVQDHGKYVAISEAIPNDEAQKVKSGGLLFDRSVARVITPGTLIDENFLNPFENNYILAICASHESSTALSLRQSTTQEVGLAWLDLLSGDFFTQVTDTANLASAIARIGPREIVLDELLRDRDEIPFKSTAASGDHVITYHLQSSDLDWATELSSLLQEAAGGVRARYNFTAEEAASGKLLINYVRTQLPGTKLRLQAPIRRHSGEYMTIDRQSLRGLEITRTMRDGAIKGSLLHSVNRTVTNSGSRLLAQRLASPSMSPAVINERLDLVESLMADAVLLEQVTDLLRQTSDTLRLLQKFSFGRGTADDLLGISRTVAITRQIAHLLSSRSESSKAFKSIHSQFQWAGPVELAQEIANAIDEDKLLLQQRSMDSATADMAEKVRSVLATEGSEDDVAALKKRGLTDFMKQRSGTSGSTNEDDKPDVDGELWIMRRNASPTLESLHSKLESLWAEKAALTTTLQDTFNAKSLTLRITPGLGHICHVKGKDTKLDNVAPTTSASIRTVSSSKSTRSFYHPAWTSLGRRLEDAKLRIRAEEDQIFQTLRSNVIKSLVPLRRNASILDGLDVASSSARIALEKNLIRPILNHSSETKIFAGRHVMVDAGLNSSGRTFTPNDCHLHPSERLWLITGPNMAGKSTFLRQTALISILAQTGMYVPAAYAEIGLVDAIFSRVGAADNLAQEQSTFMVEMLETAAILRGASKRSFVIMDEVGRGTTPEDGLAVSYAVLDHLVRINGCRALFATHFHELADMTSSWDGFGCYCTDVREEKSGAFRYDHKLRKGVNRESHALKVAQLAGLPDTALKTARDALAQLRKAREELEKGKV